MTLNFLPGPLSCGKPEQPPNSTLISAAGKTSQSEYRIGSRIEYSCDEGHLLVGPSKRSCLHTGFYSEFPPVCRCEPITWYSNDIVEKFSTIWKYLNHLEVSEYEPIILLQLVHLFQTCDMLDIWQVPKPKLPTCMYGFPLLFQTWSAAIRRTSRTGVSGCWTARTASAPSSDTSAPPVTYSPGKHCTTSITVEIGYKVAISKSQFTLNEQMSIKSKFWLAMKLIRIQ